MKSKKKTNLIAVIITMIIGVIFLSIGIINPEVEHVDFFPFIVIGILFLTFIPLVEILLLHIPELTKTMFSGVVEDLKEKNKRICVRCGREIPWDASLCPYCGHDYR